MSRPVMVETERSEKVLSFWNDLAPVMNSMCLHQQGEELDRLERPEILGLLPPLAGLDVLELAAGIGRFTESFAAAARSVVAVDIAPHFIEMNRQHNARFGNIEHVCADVMKLAYPAERFDLIFINWLLMYLDNQDLPVLAKRLRQWVKPGGCVFLRESCAPEYVHIDEVYYVHYRTPEQYTAILSAELQLEQHGHVQAYSTLLDSKHQRTWLYRRPLGESVDRK